MILESAKGGLRVVEVPITVRKRASGTTKKPKATKYAWGFTKAIIRTWLRQPPGNRHFHAEPQWLIAPPQAPSSELGTTDPGSLAVDVSERSVGS